MGTDAVILRAEAEHWRAEAERLGAEAEAYRGKAEVWERSRSVRYLAPARRLGSLARRWRRT